MGETQHAEPSNLDIETQRLLKKIQKQENDNQRLAARKDKAEGGLRALEAENASLREELEACKDDLFSLQPVPQISDTEIMNEYETVTHQILDWIDSEISAFERRHRNARLEQIFSHAGNLAVSRMLQLYPEPGEYLVRKIIHCHLQETMLGDEIYSLSLPKEDRRVLQNAERGMKSLEPPRDLATINAWRSETLSALAANKDFARAKNRFVYNTSSSLLGELANHFLVIRGRLSSGNALLNRIVYPASKLASKILLSTTTYRFQPCMENECPYFSAEHLNDFKMIDVKTGKPPKPNSRVVCDGDGWVGRVLMALEPDLVRVDRDRSIQLRQAVYLVELYEPLIKQQAEEFDKRHPF